LSDPIPQRGDVGRRQLAGGRHGEFFVVVRERLKQEAARGIRRVDGGAAGAALGESLRGIQSQAGQADVWTVATGAVGLQQAYSLLGKAGRAQRNGGEDQGSD